MDWPAFLNDTNRQLAKFREAQPGAQQGFAQLARAATQPGAIDPMTKELIALAIGISAHCDGCIGFHVRAARRHGATREQIAETVAMCLYMGGGPSLMYGAKALDAFDQFEAAEA